MQKISRPPSYNINYTKQKRIIISVIAAVILVPVTLVAGIGTSLDTIIASGLMTEVSTILFSVGVACIAIYWWAIIKTLLISIHDEMKKK
ncbi:MAG: hypothetical protein ACRD32_00770 [Nitrososphaerales archaeon]